MSDKKQEKTFLEVIDSFAKNVDVGAKRTILWGSALTVLWAVLSFIGLWISYAYPVVYPYVGIIFGILFAIVPFILCLWMKNNYQSFEKYNTPVQSMQTAFVSITLGAISVGMVTVGNSEFDFKRYTAMAFLFFVGAIGWVSMSFMQLEIRRIMASVEFGALVKSMRQFVESTGDFNASQMDFNKSITECLLDKNLELPGLEDGNSTQDED